MSKHKLVNLVDQASLALLQGKEGQGNDLLSQAFDELLVVTQNSTPEVTNHLTQIMEVIYQAQQRRDYVYLVDILKYEVISKL